MAEPLDPSLLPQSATWLAQAYDAPSDLVRFVAMTEQDYRDVSFLDDRMFQQWRDVRTLPWPTVEKAMASTKAAPASWIFHIGHVGSTLLARMLGEFDGMLSVREPRILRDLAVLDAARRRAMTPIVTALLSRSFGRRRPVIKTTSFVSEVAPELVAEDASAIFLTASPTSYILTILAGENSRKELHSLRDFRASRMSGRMPGIAKATNDAQLAAIAWACEMTSLEAAADRLAAEQTLWLDFDDFLTSPAIQLLACASHLGFNGTTGEAATVANGPLIRRYSKDPSFDYSPTLRRDLLAEAASRHGGEIDAALALLDEAANHSSLLGRALDRFVRKD